MLQSVCCADNQIPRGENTTMDLKQISPSDGAWASLSAEARHCSTSALGIFIRSRVSALSDAVTKRGNLCAVLYILYGICYSLSKFRGTFWKYSGHNWPCNP